GQSNGKHERLQNIAVARHADDHQEENEEENRSREEMTEISQTLVEGSLFRPCCEASDNVAKGRPRTRLDDFRRCRSADDGCALKDHVARVCFGRGGLCGGFLFGWERFARERCL